MSNNIAKADFPGQINRVEAAPLEPHTVVGDVAGAEYANSSEIPSANLYKGCHVREYFNTDHYIDLVWSGTAFETYGATVDITYDELLDLQLNDMLITGQFYVFEYQCKYIIPYTISGDLTDWGVASGDTVLDSYGKVVCSPAGVINTEVHDGDPYGDMTSSENPVVPIERIRVQATSPGAIGVVAWSEDYPDEMLYYDFDDNQFTDGEGTVHSRTGWIKRRVDVVKNVNIKVAFTETSSGGDYRYVRFRRWKADFDNAFSNTSGNLPALDFGTMQEDQLYFVPHTTFNCGVKPDDFDFSTYSGGAHITSGYYENPVAAAEVKAFKDYYAINIDAITYGYHNVEMFLVNAVVKPTTVGGYLYPYYGNFTIQQAMDTTITTNAVFNTTISYMTQCVHVYNITDEYYSHYGVNTKSWVQGLLSSNYLYGFELEGRGEIYGAIIAGDIHTLKVRKGIHAGVLQNFRGDVNNILSCFIEFGNHNNLLDGWCSIDNFRDSLVLSETENTSVHLGYLNKCNFYLSGSNFTIDQASNISIGVVGAYKDLEGCKILVPLSLDLDDSAINNAVVNKVSSDGEVWYDAIDNAGVVTPTKLI